MSRDIYIAIMVAAAKDKGLHLTADECFALSNDDAVAARAANGLDHADWPTHADPKGPPISWATIDPNREREVLNLGCIAPEDINKC